MPTKKETLESAWKALKQRCDNPNNPGFKNYGGRGISYESRWASFGNFYEDIHEAWKEGLMLERVDNDGDYSELNCVWATRATQNKNKRSKVTQEIIDRARGMYADGKKQVVIAEALDIDQTTVSLIVLRKRMYADK